MHRRNLHLAPTLSAIGVSAFADCIVFIVRLADRTVAMTHRRPSIVHESVHLSPFVLGGAAVAWLSEAAEATRLGRTKLRDWVDAVAGS